MNRVLPNSDFNWFYIVVQVSMTLMDYTFLLMQVDIARHIDIPHNELEICTDKACRNCICNGNRNYFETGF